MPRSLLNLPRRLRPGFFCAYLGLQTVLLFRAQRSPDFVFGFQMFNASSDLKISLFRKLRQHGRLRLVPVQDGTWQVRDRTGQQRTYRWQDRVHDSVLSNLDRYVHASYGLEGQIFRLRFALHDVATHLPGDRETQALIAVVDTLKNGRERGQLRLEEAR